MSRLSTFLILLCVSVPSFMINLDANIVAVSLPSIAHSLGGSFADVEWVISAYTLIFASFVLPGGTLGDRFGRKRILLVGLFLFTAASFVCGAAPDVLTVNLARAVQGLGAAFQLSAALAILSFEFRGPARAKAFAFWGTVIGIAMTLGPICGGFITQTIGWEWAFYINIPIGLILMITTSIAVKRLTRSTGDPPRSPRLGPVLRCTVFCHLRLDHRQSTWVGQPERGGCICRRSHPRSRLCHR